MQIHVNSSSSGNFREEVINGRDHLVTEMISIEMSSVMNGLFYSKEAVEASYMQLDNLPAPMGHPVVNGENVSANHPLAVNAFNIGAFIMSPRIDGEFIKNDLAIDIAHAKNDSRGIELIKRIKNKDKIGVSTGLNAQIINMSGEAKGRKYNAAVSDIEMDHLAILLNETPAGESTYTVNSDQSAVFICNMDNTIEQKPTAATPQTNHKGESMDQDKVVLSIIANAGNTLTESSHASLMGMSEMGLVAAIHNNAAQAEVEPVTVEAAVLVVESGGMFAINAADNALLEGLRAAETEKRDKVINSIVEKSEMTIEQLNGMNMDMGVLESLAKSVNAPAADYSMQGANVTNANSATGSITLHEDA